MHSSGWRRKKERETGEGGGKCSGESPTPRGLTDMYHGREDTERRRRRRSSKSSIRSNKDCSRRGNEEEAATLLSGGRGALIAGYSATRRLATCCAFGACGVLLIV